MATDSLAGSAGDVLDLPVPQRNRLVQRREGAGAARRARVLEPDDGRPEDREPRLTVRSPAGAVLVAHVRRQVDQVLAQDLLVRVDAPDSVHQMRVATRRLRSALATFEPLVDARVTRDLGRELRWLAAELGAARDAEVMRERIRTAVDEERQRLASPTGDGEALLPGPLDDDGALGAAYRQAHDRVLGHLDGDRYHRLTTTLQALVEQPPLRKRAERPAGTVLPRLVAKSYRRVRRDVREARSLPPGQERDEVLHDARKAAKRARYAAEAVAPVFGKDATRFAAAMENAQEALGERQDSLLTRARLQELAATAPSTGLAFLYGRLDAQEEAQGRQSEEHFDLAWKAARSPKLHRWLR